LEQKIQRQTGDHITFDPSRFGDPTAMQTGWTPARGGPSPDKLIQVSALRLEFRASLRAKLALILFFILGGLGMMAIGFSAYKVSSGGLSFDENLVMPILIGLIFSFAGSYMLYCSTAPVVFDKRNGLFWKGRKAPDEVRDQKSIKCCVKLEDIHALQLISWFDTGSKRSRYRYELNLVLKDGKRINLVLDDKKNKVRDDASAISDFLEKPVWDAI
jgi:hypothetical protein